MGETVNSPPASPLHYSEYQRDAVLNVPYDAENTAIVQ